MIVGLGGRKGGGGLFGKDWGKWFIFLGKGDFRFGFLCRCGQFSGSSKFGDDGRVIWDKLISTAKETEDRSII